MRRLVWWTLVVAAVVGVEVGYFSLVTSSVSHPYGKGNGGGSFGAEIIGAGLILYVVVLLATMGKNHYRRRHPRPTHVSRRRRRTRRRTHRKDMEEYVPVLFIATCFAVGMVIMISLAISQHAQWKRSEAVQDHGIRATGTVEQLESLTHAGSHGTSYQTVNLFVGLRPPVAGVSQTIVHTKFSHTPDQVGRTVVVLLYRRDLGYAELPGHPVSDYGGFAAACVFAALAGLVAAPLYLVGGQEVLRLRRHKAAAPAEPSA
jgi:hypothetical protein